MSKQGGYVLIYRRVLDDPDFNNVGEAMAFIYLILKAAWKPCKVHYKGKSIDLERGQVALSLRDFAEEFGWSKDKVARFLARLKRDSRATVTATGGATGVNVITICNYDIYQAKPDEGATASATATFSNRDTEQLRNKTNEDNSNELSNAQARDGDKQNDVVTVPAEPVLKTAGVIIPDAIPRDAWLGFIEMRKKLKKPLDTARAVQGIINKLRALAEDGHPPGDVLDQSTMCKWAGVFELKGNRNGTGNRSERNADLIQQAVDLANELAIAERDETIGGGLLALTHAGTSPH